MARIARTCLQATLKVVNSVSGMVGIAMILYGFWMVSVWESDMEDSSFDDFHSSFPWYIYTFLTIGTILCLITYIGHMAADGANGFCLSCYTVTILVLLLLEAAVAVDVLLNSEWEKDLPEDPTGRFHDFIEFMKSSFDIFKWIGFLIILSQGSSIFLAMALRALGPNGRTNYESDEECPPARLPLINHQIKQPSYVVGSLRFASKE